MTNTMDAKPFEFSQPIVIFNGIRLPRHDGDETIRSPVPYRNTRTAQWMDDGAVHIDIIHFHCQHFRVALYMVIEIPFYCSRGCRFFIHSILHTCTQSEPFHNFVTEAKLNRIKNTQNDKMGIYVFGIRCCRLALVQSISRGA